MARNIEAFKLRTEIAVDNAKAAASLKATEKDVDKLGARFTKLGPEIDKAFKGREAGARFGQAFSSSATAVISGSFDSFGQTIGSIIGTAVAPGIGTVIGSTLGSGFDKIAGKALGILGPMIQQGIELNKVLESTEIEFTTFVGSEKEAKKYLAELVQLSGDIGILPTTLIESSEKLYDLTGNLKLTRTLLKAAADQAQDFGGSVETFHKIADALGLIAEKGNLSKREVQQLYRVGINVPKILAEAFGKTPQEIERLMAAGRIRGEIAAGLVAASIEREKAGYAALQARTSTAGAERRFAALSQIRAGEGTAAATRGIGDFYRTANDVLGSPQAQQFVKFIDEKTGSLINLVEKASRAGINVAEGIGAGITSGDALRSLGGAFTSLGNYAETTLKGIFEIESPSQRTAREIGEPMGEGLGVGMTRRFAGYMANEGRDEIVLTLERILEDPKVRAFFEAIKRAEGGQENVIVGGKRFSDLSRHPNIVGMRTSKGPSTAAGSWQITGTNWHRLQRQLNLPDFTEHSQQLAALKLFSDREGGAGLRALLGGDITRARSVAALDWTSTPGSRIGGGGQKSPAQWMGYYNQALGANGSPVTTANPMPVTIVRDQLGGASAVNWSRQPAFSTSVGFNESSIQVVESEIYKLAKTGDAFKELVPTITDTTAPLITFDQGMKLAAGTLGDFGLGLPPLTAAERQVGDASIDLKQTLKDLEKEFGIAGIAGVDLISQLSGAIGQIAGMLPSQEVGKKRGFFSKLLGFAAPFLAFIPGVGPILSQVAGIASSAIGGNYAAAASGLAGGFQAGGVFRSSSRGGSRSGGGAMASGGAGMRGRVYWTGEHGPEPFLAPDNGYFLSHRDAMSAMGGGGTSGAIASLDEAIRLLHSKISSMRPGDVVAAGAHGLTRAMDQDAGLIRLVGQRMRLA